PNAPSAPDLTAATDSGSSSTDDLTSVAAAPYTGTAEAGSTVTLFDGIVSVGQAVATGGSYTITSSTLADGDHTLTATATDPAGNTGAASGSLVVSIDTSAPAAPSAPDLIAATDSGSSSTDDLTNVAAATYTGTAEAGSTVTLFDGASSVGQAVATGGSYTITSSSLADGDHTLTATATDPAGNTGAASGSLVVSIDTSAPNAARATDLIAATDSGASGTDNLTNVAAGTYTGTAEAGSTVTIFDGTVSIGSVVATGGIYTITTSALSTGAHALTETATDPAGNTGAASGSLVVTVDTS